MGDLAKVQSGQDFNPKAADWNSFVDAAVYVKQQQQGKLGGRTKQAIPDNTCVFRVLNDSGFKIDAFAAVAVTGLVQPPGTSSGEPDNQTIEFINHMTMKVDVPSDQDKGRFLVTTESIPIDGFGFVVAQGMVDA